MPPQPEKFLNNFMKIKHFYTTIWKFKGEHKTRSHSFFARLLHKTITNVLSLNLASPSKRELLSSTLAVYFRVYSFMFKGEESGGSSYSCALVTTHYNRLRGCSNII